MMNTLGDLAQSVATEMRTGTPLPPSPAEDSDIEGANIMDEDDPLDSERGYVFANMMRFAWKHDDEEILAKIRVEADRLFQSMFAEAIGIIDQFYLGMRVPLGPGADGRMVWQLDPDTSRPIERLDQLTGQDMDQAILNLERILLTLTPQINQLRLDALFAQNSAKDAFDDGFPSSGIADDRTSRANKTSRLDRWHAYYRYYIYSTANSFFQECKQFVKRLDSIRYRQMSQG